MIMTNILLVDDNRERSFTLRQVLCCNGYHVALAHDGKAAVDEAMVGRFDLILLDTEMTDCESGSLLQRLREHNDAPVLMLTESDEDADIIAGLEMGADDCLSKRCHPRLLLARIKAVLRREANHPKGPDSKALTIGELRLDIAAQTLTRYGVPIVLTTTEFNLLARLARDAGRVVSRKELSEQVLDRPLRSSDRNVDALICRLRKKLGRHLNGEEHIKTAHRQGYMLLV